MSRQYEVSKLRDDLIKIFDEEYENRRIITADFTAEKLNEKGYRKASDVALEVIAEAEAMARKSADEAKLLADAENDAIQKSELRGEQIGALLVLSALAKLKNKYKENEQ